MRAKKVDTTHGPIRDHLRKAGWSAISTATIGDDFPDLIVARRPRFTALVECKTPGRGATVGQVKFRKEWPGVVVQAYSPEEAERELHLAWTMRCSF